MAPAAVIPQYANNSFSKSAGEFEMDSALDFDLLAEYLLEDVGNGGFDFGDPNSVAAPPTIDASKTQPTTVSALPQDPGVVTPNGSTSFVDPLADVAAQLRQPHASSLPNGGDLAGELSQVQQMIASTQQQQAKPQIPQAQPLQPQQPLQAQPQLQSPRLVQKPQMATNNVRVQQSPQLVQKPQLAANGIATPALAPTAPLPKKNAMPVAMAQQPNKRPRVNAAPSAKGPSYSFASMGASAPATAMPPIPPAIPGGGRQKSQAQLDRRRERNRILARRTRLRKKFFFESLQKDVADLQRENAALKSIVRSRLKPDDARVILNQCNANEKLPSAIHAREGEMGLGAGAAAAAAADPGVKKLDKEDFSLIQSIQNSQQCFIITDPSLHDNPIVYASDDFLTLTGYSQEEVLGRNCRFLQGTETCQNKVAMIRKAVSVGEDVNVTFVNYTSDGKPFWNSLFIAALRDADNNIVNFIGVIVKVAGPEPGDSEYGKVLK